MNIINDYTLNSNRKVKINFEGGDLTSDSGIFLIDEFLHAFNFKEFCKKTFKTTDTHIRLHTDAENLIQVICQIILSYMNDNDADELKNEPALTTVLNKKRLASQPTLSRFFNRMDKTTLDRLKTMTKYLFDKVYSISKPEQIVLDLDSTLLNAYGKQEGVGFNYHYQDFGYHPLLCYDSLTRDLVKAELREGTRYCSNGAADFMEPVLAEYSENYPDTMLCLRGDSGFASPDLYEKCEEYNCKYVIRLKENQILRSTPEYTDALEKLREVTERSEMNYAVTYGEFYYQAGSWSHPRRVVFKIEKPHGQMIYMNTFVVTNMISASKKLIELYCKRGTMENFIKEGKNEFGFDHISSHSMLVNQNRFQVHVLAYNIFNLFRRLTVTNSLKKCQADTIRMKLFKIAAKVCKTSRYIYFKMCSSCPYKFEFYETLTNIQHLCVQLNE